MGRVVCLMVALVLFFGAAAGAFGQDGDYEVEGWKKRFASPTYGFVLAPTELDINDADGTEDSIMIPGFEIRIFNGMNVAKRGGFYTGYEVGVNLFIYSEGDNYEINSVNYRIQDLFCGTIFLLSKYGYRLDLGTDSGGLSIGPQVGIGAQMGGGSVDIYDDEDDDTTGADTDMIFGPRLELSIEGSFRFGKNFRLLGLIGANIGPGMEWTGQIEGEMLPVQPDIRIGFALNY